MGVNAHKMDGSSLAAHQPPLEEYELVSSGPNYYLWHNAVLRNSLIEFTFNINSDQLLKDHIQSYLWRHRHYLFVSTLYFRGEQDSDKYSIFYERVFTNLSKIKDLCFQDSLQFYYTGLKGFQLLYEKFGYFEVLQQMFHVTLDSKVKIWCDRNISRIYPATAGQGSQETMVRRIINIIDSNADLCHASIHVGSILSKLQLRTFDQAIEKLRSICKQNNLFIGDKLKCVQTIYRGGVEKLVDQFRCPQEASVGGTIPESSQTRDASRRVEYKHSILSPPPPIMPHIQVSATPIQIRNLPPRVANYHETKFVQLNNRNLAVNSSLAREYKEPVKILISSPASHPRINERLQFRPQIIHPQTIRISSSRSCSPNPLQRKVYTSQKPIIAIQSFGSKHIQKKQSNQVRSKSIQAWTPSMKNFSNINNSNNSSFRYYSKPPIPANSRISTQDGNRSLSKQQNKNRITFNIQKPPIINIQCFSPPKLQNQTQFRIAQKNQFKENSQVRKSPIQALQYKVQSRIQQKLDTSLELITNNLSKEREVFSTSIESPTIKMSAEPSNLVFDYKSEQRKPIFSQQRLNQIIFSFKQQKRNTQKYRLTQQEDIIFQNVFEKSQKTTYTNESTKYLSHRFSSQSNKNLSFQSTSKIQQKNESINTIKSISNKKYMPHIDQDIWNDLLKIKSLKTPNFN